VALINSTISHEMRNPLNVVINECKIIKILCEQFKQKMQQITGITSEKVMKIISKFHEKIEASNAIGTNSSEILTLNIEDLLSFAHLKSNTFFKNNFNFNISNTIHEVVRIQQHQSDSRKLSVSTHFFDFPR